jgi:hypothetical protein
MAPNLHFDKFTFNPALLSLLTTQPVSVCVHGVILSATVDHQSRQSCSIVLHCQFHKALKRRWATKQTIGAHDPFKLT